MPRRLVRTAQGFHWAVQSAGEESSRMPHSQHVRDRRAPEGTGHGGAGMEGSGVKRNAIRSHHGWGRLRRRV